MKQFITALILTAGIAISTTAEAHGGYRYHSYRHHSAPNWVVPFVVGAGAAYVLTRPQVVVEPAPVIGPSPYCPLGTGYFGHEYRTFEDQWGRRETLLVPIYR